MSLPPSLRRSLGLALDNFTRNKFLSLATIALMALILLIFNILFSVNLLAQQGIQALEEKVDLIVYLSDDADPLLVTQLTQELESMTEVTEVQYVTKEEALESLVSTYSDELNPFANYDLDNPLPASLQIVTENPQDHEIILAVLDQSQYENLLLTVESNDENAQIVNNLTQITGFTEKLLFGIVLTFLFGSILIIANAINLALFNRKNEIEIMQLVGAPLSFLRAPFMIEGAFYGLSSVAIGFLLFLLFTQTIDLSDLTWIEGDIAYLPLLGVQIVASLCLGMGSSLLALQNYLKRTGE